MKKYNFVTTLVRIIELLFDEIASTVLFNRRHVLQLMFDALVGHEGTVMQYCVSIGSRVITDIRFAENIDGIAREKDKLKGVVASLKNKQTNKNRTELGNNKCKFGMERKMMTYNPDQSETDIRVNDTRMLETVETLFFFFNTVNIFIPAFATTTKLIITTV